MLNLKEQQEEADNIAKENEEKTQQFFRKYAHALIKHRKQDIADLQPSDFEVNIRNHLFDVSMVKNEDWPEFEDDPENPIPEIYDARSSCFDILEANLEDEDCECGNCKCKK
jgi:hypothetical protein